MKTPYASFDRSDEQHLRDFLGDKKYEALASRCRPRLSRPTVNPSGLTVNEMVSIWAYTTRFSHYLEINTALRRGRVTATQEHVSKLLERALDKLPAFCGIVYRGIELGPAQLAAFLWNHVVDTEVDARAFTSTSKIVGYAYDGNVLLSIRSKTGRVLGCYSSFPLEKEVLFPRGTRFRVLDRRSIDTDGWFLDLEEVDNDS
jgi:NAD:arginine ADP-ribosyltransferase